MISSCAHGSETEGLKALQHELLEALKPHSQNLHSFWSRNFIQLIKSRSGLVITRANAFTLACHAIRDGVKEQRGEQIEILDGPEGIRFRFRGRILTSRSIASELIEIALAN